MKAIGDSSAPLSVTHPWPGPSAYSEDAQLYFHGRDRETAELLRLIRLSPFVALYGKSGLGKTSMLQAGVFPQLRKARFLPFYLRLDYTESNAEPPLQQALSQLSKQVAACSADPPIPGEGLWAYLQRRDRPFWTVDNYPLTPVLVFDQFEEVFSRGGSPAHVKAVLAAIADLAGNRLTAELADDHDSQRRLNLESQQYRVVLSFRSDYLAEVESWERQANLPKHEALHLKAMARETAIEAVERAGAAVLEPGVATQIVEFVLARDDSDEQGRATEVEPVLLCLCCFQLDSRRLPTAKIDSELLKSAGTHILRDFYNEALEGTTRRVSVFIEDNLIQGGRYRTTFPRKEAIASGALTEDEIALLTARRLLRVDALGGLPRIELIHDRLVGVVQEARNARLRRERELGLDSETMRRLEFLGYEVDARIGEGRFGTTYRARHVTDGRKVALKIRHKVLRDAEPPAAVPDLYDVVDRLAEIPVHEGINPLLEARRDSDGAFVAMAWVDGLPVTLALADSGWNAKATAIASVCDALEQVHLHGIVHGNLKPNNVFVRADGKPVVLDLVLNRGSRDARGLRNSPVVAAAAPYLAPEQVVGGEVGPAADVYALGAILYELLTGAPPLIADINDAPELPMLRRENVPEPLQRICLKALEKTADDRYRSTGEMRDDLERFRAREPVMVRPSYYNNLIEGPARGHLAAIDQWYSRGLVTDDEHVRLRRGYQGLTRSGVQAVRESRLVHWWVLALYLGGWFVLDGAAWWLALYYQDKMRSPAHLGLVQDPLGRVLVGLVPALVANGLWRFFDRRGSYRFAFAAMIVGLLSLPFAVGIGVHELCDSNALPNLAKSLCSKGLGSDQLFDGENLLPLSNIQLFIALLVAVVWGAYVAIESRTVTSAAIVALYFVALYLIGLDFRGLIYFFQNRLSYLALYMLPAALALALAGVYARQKLRQPRLAAPLFAIAMGVAILASQAIAYFTPRDRKWVWPNVMWGGIEVLLGVGYFGCARFLRDRFRVEAAAAYRVLAWLAPAAFLVGICLMDGFWNKELLGPIPFRLMGKDLTPWMPLLLVSSIAVVLLAAELQMYFYIVVGLLFFDYASWRITFSQPDESANWHWPFMVLGIGLAVAAWLTWRDHRNRTGEDIDDVGERLIRRARGRQAATDDVSVGVGRDQGGGRES